MASVCLNSVKRLPILSAGMPIPVSTTPVDELLTLELRLDFDCPRFRELERVPG
jgi:hypothetical protein